MLPASLTGIAGLKTGATQYNRFASRERQEKRLAYQVGPKTQQPGSNGGYAQKVLSGFNA